MSEKVMAYTVIALRDNNGDILALTDTHADVSTYLCNM